MQRPLPPSLVLVLSLTATLAHVLFFRPVVPDALRWGGVPVGLLGLGMAVWGSRRFAAAGTNIQTFGEPDLLVSDGLFRWSRNPMYLGFGVALAGLAVGLGSIAGFAAPVAFVLVADRWYIPFEEQQMSQTFNQQYDDYAASVRRWFGRRAIQ